MQSLASPRGREATQGDGSASEEGLSSHIGVLGQAGYVRGFAHGELLLPGAGAVFWLTWRQVP